MVALKSFISTLAVGLISQAYAAPLAERAIQVGGSGQMTYYAPGLGACGQSHADGDMVAAVSMAVFDPHTPAGNPNHNALCGTMANVSRGGKTIQVQIVDRCVGCAAGDIDVSPSAFGQLADMALGRVDVTWST